MRCRLMDRNRLGEETSPYLLQHKDNPVIGRPGATETLAAAKAADKPILLSVGYAACHWCHVMAHESFENPQIAGADERAVRQHQGRPRGAARPRRDLPARAGADGRAGRLAADDVPDPRGRAVLGRHLFPAGAALGPARAFRRCWTSIGAAYRDKTATRSRRTSRRCARRCSGSAARSAARAIGRECSTASPSGCCARSTSCNGGIGTAPKFPQIRHLRIAVARLEAHRPGALSRRGRAKR